MYIFEQVYNVKYLLYTAQFDCSEDRRTEPQPNERDDPLNRLSAGDSHLGVNDQGGSLSEGELLDSYGNP